MSRVVPPTTQHDGRRVRSRVPSASHQRRSDQPLPSRACDGRSRTRDVAITTGAATGYGIWATHSIAMLAYTPGLPIGFDLLLTLPRWWPPLP